MFVEDMAASGGYWIACSGQQVFASKTSIVGSLGVIYGGLGFTELIKKVGVERRLLTSGDNKALMDPLSPVKEEDVKIIKAMLGDIHKIFIDHVKKHRWRDGKRIFGALLFYLKSSYFAILNLECRSLILTLILAPKSELD